MYFYDTNILLSHLSVVDKEEKFLISSVTLNELEDIKTNGRKTEDIRCAARKAVNYLNTHQDKYEVIVWSKWMVDELDEIGLDDTPDNRILTCAKYAKEKYVNPVVFVSDDVLARMIGKRYLGLDVEDISKENAEEYKGFIDRSLSDEEMAYFYEHLEKNTYGLLVNEYLIIKDKVGEIVDTYRWDGEKHSPMFKKTLKSLYFDKIKPKDIYQSCAIDSMMNCTITAISGKAGSGKSLITLAVSMALIENGKYDRMVIMFNPTKTRGASDLGFYVGDFISKAMQNSIGQILTTKFGDRYAVDILLQQEKLKLVSMADARGMEIKDNEILWITECQNTSIDLIKLCLSRVSSGAKVFIEGDYTSQTDSRLFEGENNGLKRVIDVFKGHAEFGYVQLQNIWRSRIAELCELL